MREMSSRKARSTIMSNDSASARDTILNLEKRAPSLKMRNTRTRRTTRTMELLLRFTELSALMASST